MDRGRRYLNPSAFIEESEETDTPGRTADIQYLPALPSRGSQDILIID